MSDLKQNLINFLAIVIVAVVIIMIKPATEIQSRGILLPTGIKQPAVVAVKDVKVLHSIPNHYTPLGLIRTSRHFDSISGVANKRNKNDNIQLAKKLAAKAGANAIILLAAGHTPSVGPLDGYIVYAEAVRLP